jgi:hypothetical protein
MEAVRSEGWKNCCSLSVQAKARAQQRKIELEREQQAMNEVAERWREGEENDTAVAQDSTEGGGGGLDDLVASLTDPNAVQEIEAKLGPAPDDPVAYQQCVEDTGREGRVSDGCVQVHAGQVRV